MNVQHELMAAAFGLLVAVGLSASAADLPPAGGQPLSAILQSVESQHLGTIAEAEFDDGLWEIKACQSAGCNKLYIDPASGKEVRRRQVGPEELPPTGAVALSTIVQRVEANHSERIAEVEFDHGHWEVELRNGIQKAKLRISPATGRELR